MVILFKLVSCFESYCVKLVISFILLKGVVNYLSYWCIHVYIHMLHMYACMYTHAHTHTHTHTHIYIYIYIYTYTVNGKKGTAHFAS